MLVYIFSSFYKNSVSDIKDLGISNMRSQSSRVENYLSKGRNVLWFAAESVDYMLRNGVDNDRILDYLLGETEQMQAQFDENFTGIYGYINGQYIDGSGWIPPKEYDPLTRDWYIDAFEAGGDMILSEPYVDAQTGSVIISYSQLLSDRQSVISMDIVLNEVQLITSEMTMGDMGYSFVVNRDGLVIAHSGVDDVGSNYHDSHEWNNLLDRVYEQRSNEFEAILNGEACTIFNDEVGDTWYVVIVANNAILYKQLRMKVMAGVAVSIAIYAVFVMFCAISVRRIAKAEDSEEKSMNKLRQMNLSIIRSLASTIDAKDRYTSGHSQRVAEYSLKIA